MCVCDHACALSFPLKMKFPWHRDCWVREHMFRFLSHCWRFSKVGAAFSVPPECVQALAAPHRLQLLLLLVFFHVKEHVHAHESAQGETQKERKGVCAPPPTWPCHAPILFPPILHPIWILSTHVHAQLVSHPGQSEGQDSNLGWRPEMQLPLQST